MGSLNMDITDLLTQLRSIAASLATIAGKLDELGTEASPLIVEARLTLDDVTIIDTPPIPVKVSF